MQCPGSACLIHLWVFYDLCGISPLEIDIYNVLKLQSAAWNHKTIDIKRQKIDCLRFVMCPLLTPGFQGFFFMRLLTVLMKQTRQAVHAIKQSTYLDVYGWGCQISSQVNTFTTAAATTAATTATAKGKKTIGLGRFQPWSWGYYVEDCNQNSWHGLFCVSVLYPCYSVSTWP